MRYTKGMCSFQISPFTWPHSGLIILYITHLQSFALIYNAALFGNIPLQTYTNTSIISSSNGIAGQSICAFKYS